MSIDWFTFFAQIINFLILVAILRWFLYDPIVNAMQQREQRVADQLNKAEQQRTEAETLVQRYEMEQRALDEQRESLLKEARSEAQQQRARWIKESRTEVDQKRAEWFHTLDREREAIFGEFRRQLSQLTFDAARHTLTELADVDLEERIVQDFADRIQRLDEEQREQIQAHLERGEADVILRSVFQLSEAAQDRLTAAVRSSFGYTGTISFETSADLICGMELDVNGFCFGWNASEIVQRLEHDFDERMRQQR